MRLLSQYDIDGNGYIEPEEMVLFLNSVFKVLYETQPGVAQQIGVSPEELAVTTAQQCFAEADLDDDGRLSLSEFKKYFASNSGGLQGVVGAAAGVGAAAARVGESRAAAAASASASAAAPQISLDTVKEVTTLGRRSVDEVLEIFASAANEEGVLSRDAFYAAFSDIMGALDPQELELAQVIVPRLYDIFDQNGDGVVDFAELSAGLTVLCGGSREDKVKAAFDLVRRNTTTAATMVAMCAHAPCSRPPSLTLSPSRATV